MVGSQGALVILSALVFSLWVWRQVFCCLRLLGRVSSHAGYLLSPGCLTWQAVMWPGIKNCWVLLLKAVSKSRGNLLQVLVHSARKCVLVVAEVPSGGDDLTPGDF